MLSRAKSKALAMHIPRMKKLQAIVPFSFTKRIIFANDMESGASLLTVTKAGVICQTFE